MKSIYSKLVLVSLLLITVTNTVSARDCEVCKKSNATKAAVQVAEKFLNSLIIAVLLGVPSKRE